MASGAVEIPITLLHLLDSTHPHTKRRCDQVFLSPAASDPTLSKAVLRWLRALSLTERMEVFEVENHWLSSMVRDMFAWKVRQGEGVFAIVRGAMKSQSDRVDDYFRFRKRCSVCLSAERVMEHHLRFTDTVHYLDTLCLSAELLQDFDYCEQTLMRVSRGGVFRSPCYAQWDASRKNWIWMYPSWLAASGASLSAIVVAAFEQRCWAKFFEATGRDPRASAETQHYAPEGARESNYSKLCDLTAFWTTLSVDRRKAIIGGLPILRKLFSVVPKTCAGKYLKACEDLCDIRCYPDHVKAAGLYRDVHYSACRERICRFSIPNSVDIIVKMCTDCDFVEVMARSTLERAWTRFDIVARAVVEKVREAMTAQVVEELLVSESQPTANAQNLKNKKKKKQRKKDEMLPSVSIPENPKPESEVSTPEKIAINDPQAVTIQPETDDSEFCTVRRKKAEKRPRSPVPAPTSPPSDLLPLSSVKPVIPVRREPPVVIQYSNSDFPKVLFNVDMDFPPLATQRKPLSGDQLSEALHQFKVSVEKQMTGRQHIIAGVVGKVREVVSALIADADVAIFGSYATGLALPSSDLDLAVVGAALRKEEIACAVAGLGRTLSAFQWVAEVQPIPTASVPVVKLTVSTFPFGGDVSDYQKVDISFNDSEPAGLGSHIGLSAVTWVQSLLAAFPSAHECILVLKQLLYTEGLNSAYLGGLSSYSLVLWVGAYVHSSPTVCPGELLLNVLRYYSAEFDPSTTGIKLESPYYYQRPQPACTACETLDPVHKGNNTTKGAYRLSAVLEVFKSAYTFLLSAAEDSDPLGRLFARIEHLRH